MSSVCDCERVRDEMRELLASGKEYGLVALRRIYVRH